MDDIGDIDPECDPCADVVPHDNALDKSDSEQGDLPNDEAPNVEASSRMK